MYTPPSLSRPVRLFSADGHSWDFGSLETFVQEYGLPWILRSVGPAFRLRGENGFLDRTYPFVLRDPDDQAISQDECYAAWRALRARRRSSRSQGSAFEWTGVGPVPGTGKRSRGGYFRSPRTFGGMRIAAAKTHEGEPMLRGRRRRLPGAYDDLRVAARADRSWKRFRLTRWKGER